VESGIPGGQGSGYFFLVLNLKTEYSYDYELKANLILKDFAVESHTNMG
jgi:hypothetical protein